MRKLVSILLISLCIVGNLWGEEWKIPRLSPLPERIEKEKVGLSGRWLFDPAPESDFWKKEKVNGWKEIEVPGEWVMQGFEVEKGKAAGYFRAFSLPVAWKGQQVKLRCNAIYSESHIYINGMEVGSHLGGFTAFELDVTPYVRFGQENRIAVSVVSETLADSTANASRYAVHPLGGITRDLFLFALPPTHISSFHASTAFDSTYTDAQLSTEVEVSHEVLERVGKQSLHFRLKDAEGKEVLLKNSDYTLKNPGGAQEEKIRLSFDVKTPEKWNPEHPYLYTFTCQLKEDGKVLHTTSRKIGFRQIEVRGNQVFVNNHPIKLRGVCRHEVMPLRGRSLTGDIWRKDVELFRRGNVNYIRTSHYPPDEALLDACDELGMFVEVEAPFCWAHEAKVPEDKFEAVLVNQHVEMVHLNKSHPSVLMWSMGNESNLYAEYFKKAAGVVKEMDPTRPRIFSQWGPDADSGELEVTNHHYPGPTGPDMYRGSKRPVVFDEFCHLNAYNRLELAADPGLRTLWGVLLDRMWNDMYRSQGVLGGAIWAGIDDTFFLPGERAVGYGTWGPVDGWRREKPEYWGMKKAFSPVRITQKGNMDAKGVIRFGVENRYDFSDLSRCSIRWQVAGKEGEVPVSLSPRSEGSFEITLPEALRKEAYLDLTVVGVQGFLVDEYRFQVLPKPADAAAIPQTGPLTCEETAEAFEIYSLGGHFKIDKRNGLLTSDREGKPVLCEAPQLMILPLNAEGEGIQMIGKDQTFKPYNPVCENWVARSVARQADEEGIRIRVKGVYKEAEGSFTYCFDASGEISFSYDFKMLQDVSPRQVGLVFRLPASFTRLAWAREGYWSVYPREHIGALEGVAEAFDPSLPVSGLAGPSLPPSVDWGTDQTAAGSNRFRSTKENILRADLQDAAGTTVRIVADGTQHMRAWKEGEAICFLVADYTNAGNDTFLTSHSSTDFRPLRRGDRIQGTVTIQIR